VIALDGADTFEFFTGPLRSFQVLYGTPKKLSRDEPFEGLNLNV